MSSVSTSGSVARIISRATSGSGAAPTTVMSRSREKISVRSWRTSAESSTISTLILPPAAGAERLAEEFNVAFHVDAVQLAAVVDLALEDRVVVQALQLAHDHPSGAGKK